MDDGVPGDVEPARDDYEELTVVNVPSAARLRYMESKRTGEPPVDELE